jgi:hypothetical protein
MKPDLEQYLWDRVRYSGEGGLTPREVIAEMLAKKMIQSEKQAHATLDKWVRKNLYDYGVCIDLGWKTERMRQ